MTVTLFVSHTHQPGGAEQTVVQYLQGSDLPDVALATTEAGGVWSGLDGRARILASGTTSPLRFIRWLRALIRQEAPRVVVPTTMRSALFTALACPRRTPIVYWIHDGVGRGSAMSRAAVTLTRLITIPRSSALIANSEWTRQSLGPRLLARKPVLVCAPPCGLDAATIARRTPRELRPDAPVRILYLGRIAPWKAPHIVVQAVARLAAGEGRRWELTLAGGNLFGEDAYAASVDEEIAAVGDGATVTMLGHVDHVGALLDEHDIVVHTSTVPEPFGRVIVEAMAHGLPVIATDAGGPASILKGGEAGVLYPAGDVTALGAAITRVSDPAEYRAMSARALERSLDFTDDQLIPLLDAFITEQDSAGR